jgi:hypothetical protein
MLWDNGTGWNRLILCSVLGGKRRRREEIRKILGRKKYKHAYDVDHKTNTDKRNNGNSLKNINYNIRVWVQIII